jgi:tetratricopeptide (TPR) repeat protein
MSALKVLTVGVSLVFSLYAMDIPFDRARAALQQNDYTEAVRLFEQCVNLSKAGAERGTALTSYGIALSRVNRDGEAKAALEQALAVWGDEPGADRVVTLGMLAMVDRSLGDYQGAEREFRASIADGSGKAGYRSTLMVNLADLLREEARGKEAGVFLKEAGQLTGLSRSERINVLTETAELDVDMRRWDASLAIWNQIGELAGSPEFAVNDRIQAVMDGGMGEAWLGAGNVARAEPLLRKSLQLVRNDPGSSSAQLATALGALARLYIVEDKLALAEEALNEAIARDQASLGPKHPQVGALLELRATVLSRHGEAQDARDDLERAQAIMSGHFGPDSMPVAVVFAALGEVEQRANRPAAAVTQYGNALRIFRQAGAEGTAPGSVIVALYAAALKAAHRPEEARALMAAGGGQSFREK